MSRLLRTLAALVALLSVTVLPARADTGRLVRVTYYLPTGNPMYSGQYPFVGAAACSWNFPLGTRLMLPDGFVVTCLDRGLLGSSGWVDVYAPSSAWGRANVEAAYDLYTTVSVFE